MEQKEIVPFLFAKDHMVSTIIDQEDNVWWVAKEICDILEIKNPRDAVSRLEKDEKQVVVLNLTDVQVMNEVSETDVQVTDVQNQGKKRGHGGDNGKRTIINESGLYSLLFRSRKPEAKKFKRWIAHEVLPSIRKTGGYFVGQNDMSDEEFYKIVDKVKVFARVAPEHKVKVCVSLQEKGNVVAMTGDGINDSPAIKAADIGVAMGISGTEVTKEAADMTLMDDNFATIINAIREGRGIYDNIRKFIFYLLSCNIGEILTLSVAIFLGAVFLATYNGVYGPVLPLLPVQILWINLVTDGLPATALSVEPKDLDIMLRKPRDPKEQLLNKSTVKYVNTWHNIVHRNISYI